jgi:PAS domain S-box-containing protein
MRRLSLLASLGLFGGAVALAAAGLAAAALLSLPSEAVVGTTVLLAAAVAALLVWGTRILGPALTRTARAARALAAGEAVNLPPSGVAELDDLAGALPDLAGELKRRQDAILEVESRYKVLAESLPAMVWVFTDGGQTLFQNGRATAYIGRPVLADTSERASVVHPDDLGALMQKREAALRERSAYTVEARVRRHDGVYRWHLITSSPVTMLVDGTAQACWLGTAIDMEAQKQAEELQAHLAVELERRVGEATRQLREETLVRQKAERQLRHTQKMEAISRLTGGIAHDLNNKLMVISANIDSVTKHVKDQPALRRKLLSALVASDQAAALMSKLLAFARQRDLQAQYIDIGERLDSITSLLDRSFLSDSVEIRLDVDENLWPIEVDPNELETAIVNLGVNARDAMKDGGTIAIEARNVHLRRGQLNDSDLAGDFVEIRIGDTGVGIPPENLDHVFEPFFTTKAASLASGLGLSQVHGFARQLGGTVEIASTVGEGTTVSIYLPRADVPNRIGARTEVDDILDDDHAAPGSADVLVVDDEVEVALALQSMLQESGYTVRMAVGADEALEALKAHAYQLVLTDVTMPGTMDGVTLAREVRKLHPDLAVVLITGNPMVVAGASEFPLLQKPITSRDLHAAIQRYLSPPQDEGPRVVPLFPRRSS